MTSDLDAWHVVSPGRFRAPDQTQFDATRMQCGERAVLFSNHERGMVWHITPPAPNLIVEVWAATWAMSTAGEDDATVGRL